MGVSLTSAAFEFASFCEFSVLYPSFTFLNSLMHIKNNFLKVINFFFPFETVGYALPLWYSWRWSVWIGEKPSFDDSCNNRWRGESINNSGLFSIQWKWSISLFSAQKSQYVDFGRQLRSCILFDNPLWTIWIRNINAIVARNCDTCEQRSVFSLYKGCLTDWCISIIMVQNSSHHIVCWLPWAHSGSHLSFVLVLKPYYWLIRFILAAIKLSYIGIWTSLSTCWMLSICLIRSQYLLNVAHLSH